MYRSANYVLFVNYEDFGSALAETIDNHQDETVYYSGYDCDSLALEPVSNFCEFFIPLFKNQFRATLEIRTKSTQIRGLLETQAIPNCVIAMSFTAHDAASEWEHKVPAIAKRIEALSKLQQAGWKVAIRLEPLIIEENMMDSYKQLFAELFSKLDAANIHSVSTGLFRMPMNYYKKIVKLYPDESLFARPIEVKDGMVSLRVSEEAALLKSLEDCLLDYISPNQYYRCAV